MERGRARQAEVRAEVDAKRRAARARFERRRLERAWAEWMDRARKRQPTVVLNVQAWIDAEIDPRDPLARVGASVLIAYVPAAAQDAFNGLLLDGTWDAVLRAWTRDGALPVEAMALSQAGVRLESRELWRSPNAVLRALFAAGHAGADVGVEALRADASITRARRGTTLWLAQGSEILGEKRRRHAARRARAERAAKESER